MSEAAVPLPIPEGVGPPRPRWQADLALVVAAFFFGSTFLVVQDAVEQVDPVPFLAVRFAIAALALLPLALRRARTRHELRHGVAGGLALLAGYVTQTIGLQYTTSATSAFITYLLVVLVPLIGFVVLRRRPHRLTIVGVALAIGGLALLTGGAGTGFGRGEVLTLVCAFCFATHIVILGETARRHDPVRLTCIQAATVSAGCAVPALIAHDLRFTAEAWSAAAFTGVFATAVAFLLMIDAQRVVRPSRAAILLLLEPVFAAVLGHATGEDLTVGGVLGAALILVAVVVSEIVPARLEGGASLTAREAEGQ